MSANTKCLHHPLHTTHVIEPKWYTMSEQPEPCFTTHQIGIDHCCWQADASMAAMPVHAFGRHNTDTAKQWFYGSLPREAVCTENLTPWLKLLPCQGRQGLTQLMDRPTLYGASFHSLRVHLLVHNQPQDTCTADGDKTASSDGLTATLTQTLTLVLRPEQMHTQEKVKSKFSNHGKVVHRHIDLQRLFNVPGAATCSKAAHTHIYFHLPRSLIANSDPGDNTSDLHAVDNKLYSASPAPDAVVSSASAVFLLYNVTASKQQSEQSEQCLQPSITWHQQPDAWKAETPPVRVSQHSMLFLHIAEIPYVSCNARTSCREILYSLAAAYVRMTMTVNACWHAFAYLARVLAVSLWPNNSGKTCHTMCCPQSPCCM